MVIAIVFYYLIQKSFTATNILLTGALKTPKSNEIELLFKYEFSERFSTYFYGCFIP